MTAYLIDKAGFTILCRLIGGKNANIPERFYVETNENDYRSALKSLEDVGYIYISENHVDIERTIYFLISSILSAESCNIENSGERYVFQCDKLIIIIEGDRLSAKKCRIIPIKDKEMLAQYYSELCNEINYKED